MGEQVAEQLLPAIAPDAATDGRFGAKIRNSSYLPKWLLLGVTIGVISGLGAVVFYEPLRYTADLLLSYLALSSLLTRRLGLSDEDGRIAVALGIGAGIWAIIGAPLGGAVLAASMPYRDDFDYRCLLPGFISAGTAYAVLGASFGSVSRAPLAVMIMVAEMTGSFSVVPGTIIAVESHR